MNLSSPAPPVIVSIVSVARAVLYVTVLVALTPAASTVTAPVAAISLISRVVVPFEA